MQRELGVSAAVQLHCVRGGGVGTGDVPVSWVPLLHLDDAVGRFT